MKHVEGSSGPGPALPWLVALLASCGPSGQAPIPSAAGSKPEASPSRATPSVTARGEGTATVRDDPTPPASPGAAEGGSTEAAAGTPGTGSEAPGAAANQVAADEAPPAPPPTLAERLREEVGKGRPVVILPGDAGVVAMSADGTRAQTIAPGAPYAVLVDPRSQVVWYQTGTELRALDLTAPEPRPAPVVIARAPDKLFDKLRVRYTAPTEELGPSGPVQFVLAVTPEPYFEADAARCAPAHASCPKLTRAGAAFVASLAERARGKRLERRGGHRPGAALDSAGECDACGKTQKIAGTELLAVTSETCEDACHLHLGLYRPATGEFVDPAHRAHQGAPYPFSTLADAWVCAGGEVFVDREGLSVRFAGGSFDAGGRSGIGGGGCLDGGWFYPDPDT